MKNLFLIRLFRESKLLFAFIAFLCLGQYITVKKEINGFPWFYYAMYSTVENLPEAVNQFIVHIDGEPFDYLALEYWGGIAVDKSLKTYKTIRDGSMVDPMEELVQSRTSFFPERLQSFARYKLINKPEEVDAYPAWLHAYLERKLHRKISKIEVYNNWYKYDGKQFYFSGGGDIFLHYSVEI